MTVPSSAAASRFGSGLRILGGLLILATTGPALAGRGRSSQWPILNAKLAKRVRGYDNGKRPLIPTLIGLAAAYNLPMGIEKVTPQALREPVRVTMLNGTVAQLLDTCVRQLPDYNWTIREGVIDVYGQKEWSSKLNLLNFVLPAFQIRHGTLNDINFQLRMLTPSVTPALAQASTPVEVGAGGDVPGDGELEGVRVNFTAQRATVRSILNRIVHLSGGRAIWISRVPPSELSHAPTAGLWQVGPPSVNILTTLELSLSKNLEIQGRPLP